MISSITAYLEGLKDAFVPTVAKAEEDVEEDVDEDEEDEDEDDEDEDQDEEEQGDQLDALREECKATEEGKHLVHHYLECAERVAKAQEQPGYEDLPYKEDCVEEFFHLQHYLDECAAPRLFDKLK